MKCPNCGAHLSCGCQRRVASDGKAVCSHCYPTYEQNIKKNVKPPVYPTPTPVPKKSVHNFSPTEVIASFAGPGTHIIKPY